MSLFNVLNVNFVFKLKSFFMGGVGMYVEGGVCGSLGYKCWSKCNFM